MRVRAAEALLALMLAGAPAFARDDPPAGISDRERAEWFSSQCTKLSHEVALIEGIRKEAEAISGTGNRFMRSITLPGSNAPMYDRIQLLDRDIKQRRNANPNDPALRGLIAEHNALHDQYLGRMNQLIAQDADLGQRGVRDFGQLVARNREAGDKWRAQEGRYPLARAERDRLCAESERAQQAQASPQKSARFRARINRAFDIDLGGSIGVFNIQLQPYLGDGMYGPGIGLTLYGAGYGLGARFGYTQRGDWSEDFQVHPPVSAEEFRGRVGGVSAGPDLTLGVSLVSSSNVLHFDLPSGRVNVPVATGGGLGLSVAAQYGGVWK